MFISLLMSCNGCGTPKAETIESPIAEKIEKSVAEKRTETAATTDAKERKSFDHSAFDALLKQHVRFEAGRVDYAGLKADEANLDAYLKTIAEVDLEACEASDKMAILINAYNGYTLKLILENYPGVKSIRDLEKPWKTVRYVVGGETVSLDNIEHNLLRPIFKDPRIHFAVNCASIGCPALAEFAYGGGELESQLELAMKRAVNNGRDVQLEEGKLRVSSIFKWYGEDFTKEGWKPRADSIPTFLAAYAEGDLKAFLESKPDADLNFSDYDWALNDIAN
jgi:hypothetical protein